MRGEHELLGAPGAFEAWALRRVPGADRAVIRAGVYEWASLDDALRGVLAQGGHSEKSWTVLAFAARRESVG